MHLPWRDQSPPLGGPPISTSVTAAEAAELARLAAAKDVLEIGSAYGYSAIVMALAGGYVVSVDPHNGLPSSLDVLTANVDAYRVADMVDRRVGYSRDILPRLADAGVDFDLVFIDGDHSEDGVAYDAGAAMQVLRPDGWLVFHDYGEDCCCPGVRRYLDRAFPDGPERLIDTLFVVKP